MSWLDNLSDAGGVSLYQIQGDGYDITVAGEVVGESYFLWGSTYVVTFTLGQNNILHGNLLYNCLCNLITQHVLRRTD